MNDLGSEIRSFLAGKQEEKAWAAQRAALQIICGEDLAKLLDAERNVRQAALGRLARLLTRERLKGLSGHWSYDLNRHIALKQACDRLRDADLAPDPMGQAAAKKQNGARRRRSRCLT